VAEKIFETAFVSEEIGNEFHQAFSCKPSFKYDLASRCTVHHPPGPWIRNSNFRLRHWFQSGAKPSYYLYNSLAPQTRSVEAEPKLQNKCCRLCMCEITLIHLFCDWYCCWKFPNIVLIECAHFERIDFACNPQNVGQNKPCCDRETRGINSEQALLWYMCETTLFPLFCNRYSVGDSQVLS